MIGLKYSRQFFFVQSEVKPKPILTHSHAFSRALRQPPVITSSFDWFTVLCVFFVIGESNYFGFVFTTLNWKRLYCSKTRFIRRISAVSNAIETTDNEMICFIIFCLNCIRHGRNATYKPGLRRERSLQIWFMPRSLGYNKANGGSFTDVFLQLNSWKLYTPSKIQETSVKKQLQGLRKCIHFYFISWIQWQQGKRLFIATSVANRENFTLRIPKLLREKSKWIQEYLSENISSNLVPRALSLAWGNEVDFIHQCN